MGPVPQGWDVRQIGDVTVMAQYGLSIRGQASGRCPMLRMNCQVDGDVSLHDLQYVDVDDRTLTAFALSRGDILFNRTNSYELVGRSAVFDHDVTAVCASYLIRLVVDRARVDPFFLNFLLNWEVTQAELKKLASRGVSQANISASNLKDFVVHLPKLPEQQAIAQLLRHVRNLVVAEGKLEERARALKGAALHAIFSHGLRGRQQKDTEIGPLPQNWDVVPLGALGKVGNGSTPRKAVLAYWSDGTYPWLTSAKVYDREIVAANQFVTQQALDECHLPRVFPGAVLIAITGQGKTLGHCAVLRIEATINQHLAYLATDTMRADPSFLRGYLETQYSYLRQIASGGGSTKGALTCAFLKTLPVPLPPTLEEQREVATLLDAIDRKIELHVRKRRMLDQLLRVLLHELMTGQMRVSDVEFPATRTPMTAEISQ